MPLKVEIDKRSGFCGGVIRAIGTAEKFLDSSPTGRLYSLGAIVHNEAELQRLGGKGLMTVGEEVLSLAEKNNRAGCLVHDKAAARIDDRD